MHDRGGKAGRAFLIRPVVVRAHWTARVRLNRSAIDDGGLGQFDVVGFGGLTGRLRPKPSNKDNTERSTFIALPFRHDLCSQTQRISLKPQQFLIK